MKLNIGCGSDNLGGYISVDFLKRDHVDVVHDLEVFPWPFEDNSIREVRAWHVLEHIDRRKFFDPRGGPCVMGEIWRILEPNGLLHVGAPYGVTLSYIQDPTHVNPLVDYTFHYFDKSSGVYKFYETPFTFHLIHLVRDSVNGVFEMMMVKDV